MPKSFTKCIRDDYKVTDSPVTVTFTSKGVDGGEDAEATVTGAVKYELTLREVTASEGVFQARDVRWELPVTKDGWWPEVYAPKEGDRIAETANEGGADEATVGYSVLEVTKGTWDTVWLCFCRPER